MENNQHPFPLDEEAIVEWAKGHSPHASGGHPLGSVFIILVTNGESVRAIRLCKTFEGFKLAKFFGMLLISILLEFKHTILAREFAPWVTQQSTPETKETFHPYEAYLVIAETTKDPFDIRQAQERIYLLEETSDKREGEERLGEIRVKKSSKRIGAIN